jgi:tryptophan halogenase
MNEPVRDVLIVGGGTAGWMAAAYLVRAFSPAVRITLVESPILQRIGVGEATIPNLQRVLFDFLGIPELEWMREVNGSFKAAIRFTNWRKRPDGATDSWFYHSFGVLPSVDGVHLPQHWLHQTGGTVPFDRTCFVQPALLDAKRSPRFADGTAAFAYAWHFDAQRVADFLCRWATARGVRHVVQHVERAEGDGRGGIGAVITRDGQRLTADLFVDCSGFQGLLINKVLAEPFIEDSDRLLCDSAVAAQIPHDDDANGIEPFTSAIAMKAGWTWKTPMLGRFGSGYVFSSLFATDDEATRDFCALWGLDPAVTQPRVIRFRTGRNRRSWVANCVSIGLSSCFLEPLESTGIHFITAAIYLLAKHFPSRAMEPGLRDAFNREVDFMYDDCRDFVQAHYVVTDRDDTAFWLTNRHELALSDSLREKMALYRAGLPVNLPTVGEGDYYDNLENELRQFWTNGNYYSVFAGLGFLPDQPPPRIALRPAGVRAARGTFAAIAERRRELEATLPSLVDWLRALHGEPAVRSSPTRAPAEVSATPGS